MEFKDDNFKTIPSVSIKGRQKKALLTAVKERFFKLWV